MLDPPETTRASVLSQPSRRRRPPGLVLATTIAAVAAACVAGHAASLWAQGGVGGRVRRHLGARPVAGELTVTLPGGVPLTLVRIRGGTPFTMGTAADEPGGSPYEMPRHRVVVARDFCLGRTEVTQAQWQAVMGSNPSLFQACGPDCPVERVSWNDIAGPGGFLERLDALVGAPLFRLPSEAEWELAARAGTTARFPWGDALECPDSCLPCPLHAPHMWWCGNAGSTTHPVAQEQASPWGFYDMHGGVWERVEDCWHDDYVGAPVDGSAWTEPGCALRVYRGGGWFNAPGLCRSAQRNQGDPDGRASAIGFRVARSR